MHGLAKPCYSRYEAALAFNRSWVEVASGLAICKSYARYLNDVIAFFEQAIRLGPRSADRHFVFPHRAVALPAIAHRQGDPLA
jgi:hypothetical protein